MTAGDLQDAGLNPFDVECLVAAYEAQSEGQTVRFVWRGTEVILRPANLEQLRAQRRLEEERRRRVNDEVEAELQRQRRLARAETLPLPFPEAS